MRSSPLDKYIVRQQSLSREGVQTRTQAETVLAVYPASERVDAAILRISMFPDETGLRKLGVHGGRSREGLPLIQAPFMRQEQLILFADSGVPVPPVDRDAAKDVVEGHE